MRFSEKNIWQGTQVSGRGLRFLAGDEGFWQGTKVFICFLPTEDFEIIPGNVLSYSGGF